MSLTSFVIASRDRSPEVVAVVERLLRETDCPVIVVDNGSRDDSVLALHRAGSIDPGRLRVIPLAENLGAVGRNVGVSAAETPFVAFCDDDSWWEPDATVRAEKLFAEYPTVGLLAARTVVLPSGRTDELSDMLAASPLGHDPSLPGPSILGFLACSSIVRKEAFEAVGGFSSILHFRGEEGLLAIDLAAAGWDLCFCPDLVAYHQPSSVRPPNAVQDARSLRNDVLTTWLRRPPRECVRAATRLARAATRDEAHARAMAEAVRLLPSVARDRRRLPRDVEESLELLARS
ncbi:glycosyltransferase family 2 protein [Mycolicibacterium sp. GCM10028919]|uniref:glycosyltransferase family 2 protein n=1 Tax=Mycolicibacterium sp. GCM10028919 TaxID=3273401 RepID=UPI00361E8540